MPSSSQIHNLARGLSNPSQIYSNHDSPRFRELITRWSDIERKIPAAIVIPSSEDDCCKTVQWAISTQTPFVCKSGGMSLYSTIGNDGIVVDLSGFASITHDSAKHQATLVGGVLSKTVGEALAKIGHFTPLPSANPVGAIPFFLNGGNSPVVSLVGYGSDNIMSARMITAEGALITISESENSDLLYAIRGAGQYFGLVTALTVRTFPSGEYLGAEDGSFWSGPFVFPIDRAQEVGKAMEKIIHEFEYNTGGLIMVAAPPPAKKPAVVVLARLTGRDASTLQQDAFKVLYDLQPLVAAGGMVRIENIGDATEALCAPGGYKKLRLTGIQTYNPALIAEVGSVWKQLVESCPDAENSAFSIQWESKPPAKPSFESANCMHAVRFWANNLLWYSDPSHAEIAEKSLEEVISLTRNAEDEEDKIDFANSVRDPVSPLTRRYKGAERINKLKLLKKKWDPQGLFTSAFLS